MCSSYERAVVSSQKENCEERGKCCCSQRWVCPFPKRASWRAIDTTGTSVGLESSIAVFLLELCVDVLMTTFSCVDFHMASITMVNLKARQLQGRPYGKTLGGDPETWAGDEFTHISLPNSKRFGFKLPLPSLSFIHSKQEYFQKRAKLHVFWEDHTAWPQSQRLAFCWSLVQNLAGEVHSLPSSEGEATSSSLMFYLSVLVALCMVCFLCLGLKAG